MTIEENERYALTLKICIYANLINVGILFYFEHWLEAACVGCFALAFMWTHNQVIKRIDQQKFLQSQNSSK